MGSFSFLKADNLTKVSNIVDGGAYKFLIPSDFGGGYIKENYQGYGHLGRNKNDDYHLYDMYELVAFWNADIPYKNGVVKDYLKWKGDTFPIMKECDSYTIENRRIGLEIYHHCDMSVLHHPLKLVSASYNGTYEECAGRSIDDPNQGFRPLYRVNESKGVY